MGAKDKSNEIRITRVYDAPVKMVWDAWTDPAQVAQWWGPRGFTLTHHSKDLRPGGSWVYTMHGPDGKDWPNKTLYHVVEPYKRLVYDHGASDDAPPLFRVTATFTDEKGKTRLDMTMTLATPEIAQETRKFIKKAGGESTWDRLAEYLDKEISGKERFVINRSFDAPIATIFEMFTNPDHLAKWLPPTGFQATFLRAGPIVQGAKTHFCMSNDAGVKMYARAEYLEVQKPKRIVYTQQFCDEDERPARHPMAPTWPETMLTVVTLSDEGPDQTRVTICWEVTGAHSAEELAVFVANRAGMTTSWTGSFDKLEAYLDSKRSA